MEEEKEKLVQEIQQLLRRIGPVMGESTPHAWMDLNVTIAQLKSLFFVDFAGTTNLTRLAAALGVSSPTVTGIVDHLVNQGLVSREENPENRRMLLLKTTERGRTLITRLRERGAGRISSVLGRLDLEDLAALARGLSATIRALETSKEQDNDQRDRS